MINKLIKKIKKLNAPVVIGLDTIIEYIPKYIKEYSFKKYGYTLEGIAEAVWIYNKKIINSIYDLIPAIKIQIAMYEQLGIPGIIIFKRTIEYCRKKKLIVIGDIKRGDIGISSMSYAIGHIGKIKINNLKYSIFNEDFITVNPYFGFDGIKPFIDICKKEKKGIFIIVKTSNLSSYEFQDQLIQQKKPLYEFICEKVNKWSQECINGIYSNIGIVLGATYPNVGKKLRSIIPKSYILVPGYGAQNACVKKISNFFNNDGLGAIINSSRGIITAYKQKKYKYIGDLDFDYAARIAVKDMIIDINNNIFLNKNN